MRGRRNDFGIGNSQELSRIAARWSALRAAPMAFIFPVSKASRMVLAGIFRRVSGRGAPAPLVALWQMAQRALNKASISQSTRGAGRQ